MDVKDTRMNVLIAGATGMIGEGLLHECLHHGQIGRVVVIGRRACGWAHPKLTEIIHQDLSDISGLAALLSDCHACFYCVGTTAVGKTEAKYTAENNTLPLGFASGLVRIRPDMTFCYISGAGTDSTERGPLTWARVKGKTENELLKLPFARVYNFRPAGLIPFLPLKPSQTYYWLYKYFKWPFVLLKPLLPNYIMDLRVLTTAMINVAVLGYSKNILETKDIELAADRIIE